MTVCKHTYKVTLLHSCTWYTSKMAVVTVAKMASLSFYVYFNSRFFCR